MAWLVGKKMLCNVVKATYKDKGHSRELSWASWDQPRPLASGCMVSKAERRSEAAFVSSKSCTGAVIKQGQRKEAGACKRVSSRPYEQRATWGDTPRWLGLPGVSLSRYMPHEGCVRRKQRHHLPRANKMHLTTTV